MTACAETFPVVEIFASRQGEGANTGREAVFVRLGGCNLACPWCDTDFAHARVCTTAEILAEVRRASPARSVIVTGGEPLIHPNIRVLLSAWKREGYWIGMESNGVLRPDAESYAALDYLTVSPKAGYAERYRLETMAREADEVRIVVDGEVASFCREMRERITARHYFLSPCERNGRFNWDETVCALGALNLDLPPGAAEWLLSVQTHKLAGFR